MPVELRLTVADGTIAHHAGLHVHVDNTVPSVAITDPTPLQVISGEYLIRATASDNAIS